MVFNNKCCVPMCEKSKIRHSFPNPLKDLLRFRKWLEVLNIQDLVEMDPMQVFKTRRICHAHFENKYVSALSTRLLGNAVPTLYLPDKGSISIDEESEDLSIIPGSSNSSKRFEGLIEGESEDLSIIPGPSDSSKRFEGTIEGESEDLSIIPGPSERFKEVHEKITKTTPYKILKKIGINKQNITPKKRKLYAAMKKLHKKFYEEKYRNNSFKRRLDEAEKFNERNQLQNIEQLNHLAAMLIQLQYRESNKLKHLRRFTLDEKFLALTLLKQSPRSYSFLSKIFILPSKSTLSRLLALVVGGPGIHTSLLKSLEEATAKMEECDKFVAILFDEMSILPSLHFNEHCGYIEGFEDMGAGQRRAEIADHVLLFMVRGLKKPWKAPVSYHFSGHGGTKTIVMKQMLIKVTEELIKIGLKPITAICDQYNKAVLNSLIQETREKYLRLNNEDSYRINSFEVKDCVIFPILDPPHLLKGIRNNFLKKNLHYFKGKKKTAKWEHIKKLYEYDSLNPDKLRMLPHLSDQHIYEEKIKKMKVKTAAQIFSQRLAATLQTMSRIDSDKRIGSNIDETAELLLFFDELFDSLNGSSRREKRGKTLRCGLSENSEHLRFWCNEALPLLESMEFEKNSARDQSKPPTLKNWVFTLKNVMAIWNVLKRNGFEYLLTRRLNQDPIENTFGQLRALGSQNTNPLASQFVGNFKTLLVNKTLSLYKDTFNCEDDKCLSIMNSLKLLINPASELANVDNLERWEINFEENIATYESTTLLDKMQQLSTSYVAGFILKKIKKIISCKNCRCYLFSNLYSAESYNLISSREYGGSWARRLCYPTSSFTSCFYNIFKIINICLEKYPESEHLVHIIQYNIKKTVCFNFLKCEIHKQIVIENVIKISMKTIIHYWCKSVNNILLGKSRMYNGNNKIKQAAVKICKNRFKNKRK